MYTEQPTRTWLREILPTRTGARNLVGLRCMPRKTARTWPSVIAPLFSQGRLRCLKLARIALLTFCHLVISTGLRAQDDRAGGCPDLVLSNGSYPEVFTNDTLQRMGRWAFNTVTDRAFRSGSNGKESEIEVQNGLGTSHGCDSRLSADRVGRWLSLDPKASKYPESSPYAFGANSPIITLDPNGGENVVYLVLLNPNSTKLTKPNAQYVAALTTARLMAMGLNTRVQVFEGNAPFDPRNLDKTDSYVMFGTKEEILNAVNGPEFEEIRSAGMDGPELEKLGTNRPEESVRNGAGVFVEESALCDWAKKVDERKTDLASLIVAHGMGHNAGVGHRSGSLIMWDGGQVSRMLDQSNTYQDESGRWAKGENPDLAQPGDFFYVIENWDYIKAIKDRFGKKESKDNYFLNQCKREKR